LYDYVKTMLVRVRSRASANPSKVFGWVAQQAAMEADLRSSVVIVDCGIVSGEPPNEEQPEYQQDSDGVYRPKPKDLSKPKSTAFAQQKRRRRRKKKRVLH